MKTWSISHKENIISKNGCSQKCSYLAKCIFRVSHILTISFEEILSHNFSCSTRKSIRLVKKKNQIPLFISSVSLFYFKSSILKLNFWKLFFLVATLLHLQLLLHTRLHGTAWLHHGCPLLGLSGCRAGLFGAVALMLAGKFKWNYFVSLFH